MNFRTQSNVSRSVIFFGGAGLFIKLIMFAAIINVAQAQPATAPSSFADLADELLPTVVNISSTQKMEEPRRMPRRQQNPFQFPEGHPFEDFFDDFFHHQFPPIPQQRMRPMTSLGSGFVIDKEKGLVITNNHVIATADEIQVTLHDDTVLPAEVLGSDEKTDIALLKVDLAGEDVREAQFGDSDAMRVGDWVIAIGNPFGLGGTVTAGIISARQRDIQSGPYDDYLQTDASINRGNSGGPMFNMNGEVIGINTAIFSPTGGSVGIGFAIPSQMAQPVIDQLNEYGRTRRGWLGVKIQEVTDEIAENFGLAKAGGALVAEVTPTGPAEGAGIQSGDIILAFNNKPIREMRELPRIVAETDINKEVPIIVWRDGERVTLTVETGELEKAEEEGLLAAHGGSNTPDMVDDSVGMEFPAIGLTVQPLSDSLRDQYAIDAAVSGLVVTDLNLNGQAARKGISRGDVIINVNRKDASLDTMRDEIDNAKQAGRESILLLINHQGSIQFVAVRLEADETEEE